MAKKVIDISAWQGKVSVANFKKVAESGVYGVILRSSYTEQNSFTLHEDKVFENNLVNAHKAGLHIGAYHYSQAISETEARNEAKFAVKILQYYQKKHGFKIDLPVAHDWEFGRRLNSSVAKNRGKQGCKQICDAFCKEIQNAGYTPMVYANLSTLTAYIASDIYKTWAIWVAQYHSTCDYKHPYYMWQYSSSGSVPGLPGRIDMNKLYGNEIISTPSKATTYPYQLPTLPKRGWFASGDKGTEVKKLQRLLSWYNNCDLEIDGEVGRKTIEAVKKFEGREKLTVDGCFGKKCLERAKTVKR